MTEENKLIAVVRTRGRVGVRGDIQETLERLKLKKPNSCVIIKLTPSYLGMVKKCYEYVAYGEVNEESLQKLISKNKDDINAKSLISGELKVEDVRDKLVFHLHPPTEKAKVLQNETGRILGDIGSKINELINLMV
ncbi:MAG: uL30 family ribosomal protein [Candidatus Micrarchaeia archaeon]